jgi:hypothetical protein
LIRSSAQLLTDGLIVRLLPAAIRLGAEFRIGWMRRTGVTMSDENTYEMVSAPYPAELSDAVSARIAEGWKLFGAPFTNGQEFFQAVVRAAPDDKRLRRTTTDGEKS